MHYVLVPDKAGAGGEVSTNDVPNTECLLWASTNDVVRGLLVILGGKWSDHENARKFLKERVVQQRTMAVEFKEAVSQHNRVE